MLGQRQFTVVGYWVSWTIPKLSSNHSILQVHIGAHREEDSQTLSIESLLLMGCWSQPLLGHEEGNRNEVSTTVLITELETFNKHPFGASVCTLRTKGYLLCSRPPELLGQILPGRRWDGVCGQIHVTIPCRRPS